jgi:hypothetical protein
MNPSTSFASLLVACHLGLAGAALAAQPGKPDDPVTVGLETRHSAIVLAGDELAKYLGLMADNPRAAAVVTEGTAKIQLGLLSDFGVTVEGVKDPSLDDAIYTDVRNSKGVIAGSNPRSVLFAT